MTPHAQVIEEMRPLVAEIPGKPIEVLEGQLLIAHDDDLVPVEDLQDLAHRGVFQRLRQIDAGDLRAERTGQRLHR